MYGSVMKEINEKALERVKHLIPNAIDFMSDMTFNEFYEADEAFIQVIYYDRTQGYSSKRLYFSTTLKLGEVWVQKIKEYNKALKVAQNEVVEAMDLGYDKSTYYTFQRVGDNLGICHLSYYERHKSKEAAEEVERDKEHDERMKTDKAYREEIEWFQEEYRPYGGAFSSWDDYYNQVR